MNRTTSVYFDFVRFISALLVLTYHAKFARFDGAWLKEVGAYGHDAVIIFFVLSGFIIAYITKEKESTFEIFAKSRFARLYSVVVPALFLTLILDFFGKSLNLGMYEGQHYQASEPVFRFISNLFFVNELWFDSWRAFSNGPFWSLSYEFWYYAIFAAFLYCSGRKRWFVVCGVMLIAGPKILLLFPVWMMGVVTFHLSQKIKSSSFLSIVFAIAPLILYFFYKDAGVKSILLKETIELLGRDFVYQNLNFSRWFLSDYIVGWLVSVHFIGMISLAKSFNFPLFLEKPIQYFAGMTFSIYLFHYPLLQFFGSIFYNGIVTVILTFLSIMLIAPFTEGKKRECMVLIEKLSTVVSNARRAVSN